MLDGLEARHAEEGPVDLVAKQGLCLTASERHGLSLGRRVCAY